MDPRGAVTPARREASVVVRALSPELDAAAAAWAARLGLPLAARAGASAALALEVGAGGLALRAPGGPAVGVSPRRLARRHRGGPDLLLRALGRADPDECVADATAGLGADAFRLAARGHRVVLIERVALVAALLEDALGRAGAGSEGAEAREAASRMRLLVGDARTLLRSLDPRPAVVVLDPMFPPTSKRALPPKGMALFRELVGGDADADATLEVALEVATRRVVVKRSRRAPPLGSATGAPEPTGSVVGTTTRFDLYAPRRRAS